MTVGNRSVNKMTWSNPCGVYNLDEKKAFNRKLQIYFNYKIYKNY